MFWILWLPLIIFGICTLIGTILALCYKDSGKFGYGFMFGFMFGGIACICGLGYNSEQSSWNLKSVYADLENPTYIETIPGNTDGQKYLIFTEDLTHGGNYSYYYLNAETNIPEYASIDSAQIRLVYDSPAKPYFAEIMTICKVKSLWILTCTNPSPYKLEFHLPPNSILKY